MYKGKSTCQQLKKIRREIAEANHIPWEDSECHYEGDCAGTCPKCDAELRFLENALRMSKQLGKAVALSGAALSLAACSNQTTGEPLISEDASDVEITEDSTKTDSVKTEAASFPVDIPIPGEVITEGIISDPVDTLEKEDVLEGEVPLERVE